MLVAHILMMIIPGLSQPISTGQIFESGTACEIAKRAIAANDPINTVVWQRLTARRIDK